MKKLMIAAAMVCAAAMSYGAATTWKCSISSTKPLYLPGTETELSSASPVYIFMDQSATFRDTLVEAFAAGTLNLSSYTYAGTAEIADGILSDGENNYKVVSGGAVGANSTLMFAFETIIDGDKYLYISEDVTTLGKDGKDALVTFKESTISTELAQDAAAGYKADGWYTAVPEPTSGLLLLLGVAGLALRRRRA